MTKTLDCRGLACPAPVLQTKDIIEKHSPDSVRVIVDNEAAGQNVSRFLGTQQFDIIVEQKGSDFHVVGTAGGAPDQETISRSPDPDQEKKKIMVMVATDRMGHGDDELGLKLMTSFIKTLKEMGEELWRLVLVNNGVKLTIPDSDVLPVLKEMEKDGTYILVCGTCLTHFDLLDKKQVGETTNMLDIVTAMQLADKVINI